MTFDGKAIAEFIAVSRTDSLHTLAHYLYVPKRGAASALAAELEHSGFSVEVRLGADGVNWLVLALQEALASEEAVASTRSRMELLVARYGGEYDGWEATVSHRRDRLP